MVTKYCLAALFALVAGIAAAEAVETDQPAIGNGGGAGAVNIVEADQPMFKFGGFGTLGASHSSQNLGDYVVDSTIPKGAGRSNNWSWGNDSRIAANLTAN